MRRLWLILFLICMSFQAHAISLISDEETESYLFDVLAPIFRQARLPLERDYIHIVKDDSLNAFVGDQNHMFIHTGTLLKASNSNEIEGVLAHETGHILGGHILRLKMKLQDMQKATLTSLIAAAGAAVASGRGDAAIAVVLGSQSSAINAVNAYQMSEERAADETAAMLLSKNHKSVKGIRNFMEKIQHTNRLQGIEENPYFRTHPVTTERISFFNEKLKKEPYSADEQKNDERLKRIQAKLFAYLEDLPKVMARYPLSDKSIAGNIAHSVYYMRQKNINMALKYANLLIEKEPDNPYFWELKAQTFFESGNIKEAVVLYKKVLHYRPQSDLFKLSYAEALLADFPQRKEMEELIPLLEHVNRHQNYPVAYLYLGRIYANMGQEAEADYFAAEYNYATGDTQLARKLLAKALKSPMRPEIKLRADDLDYKLKNDTKRTSLF